MLRRAVAAGLLCLGGCVAPRPPANPLAGMGDGRASADLNPFVPAEVRIHPLTRLEGEALVLHVEFRDAYRDTVKGAGVLRVTMLGEAGEGEDLRWTIDLRDPELNARLYDRATRTYRCPLVELPTGVVGALSPRGAGMRCRVVFEGWGPDGSDRRLIDERALEP